MHHRTLDPSFRFIDHLLRLSICFSLIYLLDDCIVSHRPTKRCEPSSSVHIDCDFDFPVKRSYTMTLLKKILPMSQRSSIHHHVVGQCD
mmetsp:Transcript_3695/g.8930  ORF Transcript_3695/g.8930 Transcript_3695/m.8930 type:complete len:89 (+) Transcript_3695:96-362(+)